MKTLICIFIAYFGLSSAETIPELAEKLNGLKFIRLLDDVGLTDMLSGTGPFTVFVPTDNAFDALADGVLNKIMKDKELLKSVLLFHILSWKIYTKELKNEKRIPTLNNNMKVRINLYNKKIVIDGSKVLLADQNATNGVIHVIDKVLVPLPSQNMLQYLASDGEFYKFVHSFVKVKLERKLIDGPFTLFAPTDTAFDQFPPYLLIKLVSDDKKLTDALNYHLVKGTLFFDEWNGTTNSRRQIFKYHNESR
ncbi:BIGH3 [Mytilus edulis]|uniref:TGFBI n=1 Tax=Mytilus edulis TaxID=6550 RepID=A0A8S3QHE4_MYTED|nr:BIGH3 [Mytilus edulis]